jgi:hypothetical protein
MQGAFFLRKKALESRGCGVQSLLNRCNRRNPVQNGLLAHADGMEECRVHAEVFMQRLVRHQAFVKKEDR